METDDSKYKWFSDDNSHIRNGFWALIFLTIGIYLVANSSLTISPDFYWIAFGAIMIGFLHEQVKKPWIISIILLLFWVLWFWTNEIMYSLFFFYGGGTYIAKSTTVKRYLKIFTYRPPVKKTLSSKTPTV